MRDEHTITFDVWPVMLMIEGPSIAIGMLISMIYNDPSVARDAWSVTHTEKSRKDYADVLKRSGDAKKRQGMGIREEHVVELVQARAKALGLSCFRFSRKTEKTL